MTGVSDQINDLVRSFSHATPEQVAQLVATVDRLPQRALANQLLAPLRARLSSLNIPRSLTLQRLSFQPLDPLIIDLPNWVFGHPLIPRSALNSLYEIMRAGNPELPQAEALLGRIHEDGDIRRTLESLLWKRGAQALQSASLPADWRVKTGLTPADFPTIRAIAAFVLHQADRLRALDPRNKQAQTYAQLKDILKPAAEEGGAVWQAILLLLCRNGHLARPALRAAQDIATTPELVQGIDQALVHTRELLHLKLAPGACGQIAPADLAGVVELITELNAGVANRGDRKAETEHLRREADAVCTSSVAHLIAHTLLPHLDGASQGLSGEIQQDAESAACKARCFGLVSQGLGAADRFEQQLRPVVDRLLDPNTDLQAADRARFLEILGKNELAMQVMQQHYAELFPDNSR